MNICQRLLVTAVGIALGLTVAKSEPVQATTFTYAYQTFDPNPAGTQNEISGTFQFDDTVASGIAPLTNFTLNWLDASGKTIASFAGNDFVAKPSVEFFSPTQVVGLTGGVSGKVDNLTTSGSFTIPNITFFGFSGNLVGPDGGVVATCRFCQVNKLQLISKSESVPEPGILAGLVIFSLAGLFLRRGGYSQKRQVTD